MSAQIVSRRVLLTGAAATAVAPALHTPAAAYWPLVLSGIRNLVLLWQGAKMAEEVYERFFAQKRQPVIREIERVYGPQVVIQNYYQFGNPYRIPGLLVQPGCECWPRERQYAVALCCGTQYRPVLFPSGCLVALNAAVAELRRSQSDENTFAYTRPMRYVRPVEPWQEMGRVGMEFKTDLQYYAHSGSVALRWHITNKQSRICRGEYLVRDDYSRRIVAQGMTSEFNY